MNLRQPSSIRDELVATVRGGDAVLFTGAGFSVGARDGDGRPLPDGEEMRRPR